MAKIIYLNRAAELCHSEELQGCPSCGGKMFTIHFFTPGHTEKSCISDEGANVLEHAADSQFDTNVFISGYQCESCGSIAHVMNGKVMLMKEMLNLEEFIHEFEHLKNDSYRLVRQLELISRTVKLPKEIREQCNNVLVALERLHCAGWLIDNCEPYSVDPKQD